MTLTLSSPAFAEGDSIPLKYTRDGENLAPPLRWTGAPDAVKSFLLVVEDPDAPSGTFRHFGVANIPAESDRLAESIDTAPEAAALRFARNDFGNVGYDGPEPPRGHGVHHYHFRLAALDVPHIGLPADVGVERLWQEARKHLIEEAELVGTYER
jgi:Raf kinase inhibitor-like YbhB/YbcL family protein